MKFVIFLSVLFVCSLTYGQVAGTYFGREHYGQFISYEKNKTYELYNHKKILLNADSSFVFWGTYETENATCVGCIDTIWITGKWDVSGDTIILNSNYKDTDFVSIIESSDSSKFTKFIYQTKWLSESYGEITINGIDKYSVYCQETTSINRTIVDSINFEYFVQRLVPLYEYLYIPKSRTSNVFTIIHPETKTKNGNSSYILDKRFIAKNKTLIPTKNTDIMRVDNWYEKK